MCHCTWFLSTIIFYTTNDVVELVVYWFPACVKWHHAKLFRPLYVLTAISDCLQVFEALGALKFPYIYPDPESRRLRAALAKDSGLESDYILVGCGADELIDLIMRL